MSSGSLLSSLDEVLAQGELLLEGISDATYIRKVPEAFNASIGAHYRHSLEHLQMVVQPLENNVLDYDARARSPRLETERAWAQLVTRELRSQAVLMTQATLSKPLIVRSQTSYASEQAACTASFLEREIMFVIAHAIHHYAVISLICGLQQIPVPEGFGVAPSTLQHQAKTSS